MIKKMKYIIVNSKVILESISEEHSIFFKISFLLKILYKNRKKILAN